MSGLRASSGLTNLVADTLRLRDLSGGFLTLSDRGVVRNDSSPALQNLTVSGQSQLHNTTVFGSLTANSVSALASITSPYAAIGSLDVSSAAIDRVDISSATINHADISSAVIDYLPQFDSAGNIFSIIPISGTLPQLIASYNQLITLFVNRNIFLSLSTLPVLIFQTPCEIHIAEFHESSPNTRVNFTYSQPSQLGIAAGAIVRSLNEYAIEAGANLRFYLNDSQVSFQEESGYVWVFSDPSYYGSANRFLNHLGLTDLSASELGVFYAYTDGSGGVIANPTGGSPVTPAAPGIPDISGSVTPHGFTIALPAQPPDVKKIGIFLDHDTNSIHPWDIIASPATTYTFHDLVPGTNYVVHLTFLSIYDESPLSQPRPVTTPIQLDLSFNILSAAETTVPSLPLPPSYYDVYNIPTYNNQIIVVAQTTAEVWNRMPDLDYVSQISSIELQYYSGFSESPLNWWSNTPNIQDARFMFYPNLSPPVNDGVILYYSYASRMAKTDPGSLSYAIGSSNPPNTSTDPPAPAASVFISEQIRLQAMFGNGTDTINKTGFQFAWYCGYFGAYIQNMNISKFIINYTIF